MISRDLFDANSVGYGDGWRVTLIKVSVGQTVNVRFYGRQVLQLGVHFLGRAIPCSGDSCPACFAGLTPRPTFFLPCLDPSDRQHFGIVEIGVSSWSTLHDMACTIPGEPSWLTAELTRRSPNKPVQVKFLDASADQGGAIQPQHAAAMIARLFELPLPKSDNLATWHDDIILPLNQKLLAALRKL